MFKRIVYRMPLATTYALAWMLRPLLRRNHPLKHHFPTFHQWVQHHTEANYLIGLFVTYNAFLLLVIWLAQ